MSRNNSLLAVIATTLLFSSYVSRAAGQSSVPGSASQPAKVLAPHKPVMPAVENPVKWPTPATTRSMVGGFWMTDANFKSSIQIKNVVETDPVKVTPVLYLSNGKRYPLREVALEPSGTAVVSINDALKELGIAPWATLLGYVEVEYHWLWDPVCVTVISVDTVHSVIFTTGLAPSLPANPKAQAWMAGEPRPQLIEGMWWKQEANVTGFVALSNTTERVLDVSLRVTDAKNTPMEERTVSVSPHGTKMAKLPDLGRTGNSGGLEVSYVGKYGELLASGGLQDNDAGYSASLPFMPIVSSSQEISHTTYAEIGLMTGAADPMMQFPENTTFAPYSVIRNVSDQNVTITPTLYWMRDGAAQSRTLPKLVLVPGASCDLDTSSLLTAAGVANLNGSVNLILDVLGKPGSALLASGSVDKKNTYVFEVMAHAVLESASKGIGYWSTGNGDDTMVTLWNPADEDQDFVFTLFFSGGHYNVPIHLSPRATRMFNISELVQNQVPDDEGNIIPASVHEGSGKLSGSLGENQHILVSIDEGIYNVRKATCHYGCNTCHGAVFNPATWIVDKLWAIPVGGNHSLAFYDQWDTGIQRNLTKGSTWSSSATNIATANAGLVNGVAEGDVTINGVDASEPWAGQQCGSPAPACPADAGVDGGGGSGGSVLLATITIQSSGTIPTANSARDKYKGETSTYNLGNILDGLDCFIGYQATGTLDPSSYTGTVTLVRTKGGAVYDGATGETLLSSYPPGTDDSSEAVFEVTTPINGVVYDLDAPLVLPSQNQTWRMRLNFFENAQLPDGTYVANEVGFYVRFSCKWASSGSTFATDVAGDNVLELGTTKTSWNLQ